MRSSTGEQTRVRSDLRWTAGRWVRLGQYSGAGEGRWQPAGCSRAASQAGQPAGRQRELCSAQCGSELAQWPASPDRQCGDTGPEPPPVNGGQLPQALRRRRIRAAGQHGFKWRARPMVPVRSCLCRQLARSAQGVKVLHVQHPQRGWRQLADAERKGLLCTQRVGGATSRQQGQQLRARDFCWWNSPCLQPHKLPLAVLQLPPGTQVAAGIAGSGSRWQSRAATGSAAAAASTCIEAVKDHGSGLHCG